MMLVGNDLAGERQTVASLQLLPSLLHLLQLIHLLLLSNNPPSLSRKPTLRLIWLNLLLPLAVLILGPMEL